MTEQQRDNDDGDTAIDDDSIDDEMVLFGKAMSTQLADRLAQRLEESFQSNSTKFPMLHETQPLVQQFRDSYLVHVDLLEEYCNTRVFAVKPFVTAKQRNVILQQCQNISSADQVEMPSVEEHEKKLRSKTSGAANNNQGIVLDRALGTETDLQKEMEMAQKKLVSLRRELKETKSRCDKLKQRMLDIDKASELSKMAAQQKVSTMHDSMTALVTGTSELSKCNESGRSFLVKKKRDEAEEEEELLTDLAIDLSAALKRKKSKMLTLEERYNEECHHINLKECLENDGPHRRLLVVEEDCSPERKSVDQTDR